MKRFNPRIVKSLVFATFLIFSSTFLLAQSKIEGHVVDAVTKAPLEGVSVTVRNAMTGTATNVNGGFNLNAPANSKLLVSFVGYEPKEFGASQGDNITCFIEIAIMFKIKLLKQLFYKVI